MLDGRIVVVSTLKVFIHCEAEKGTIFLFSINLFNMQCDLTKFSTLIVNEY